MAAVSPAGLVIEPDPYRLIRAADSAAVFHSRLVPDPARRELWWHDIDTPALVIGSTQDDSVVDRDACERAGVEVVRRRSGGGAVLLVPGSVTWLDVIVPTGAPGWTADVHAAMVWLGHHLADALGDVLVPDALSVGGVDVRVHEGPMVTTGWSSTVCFDGIGAGEVLLHGEKLIGISQRRTRHAARLQCCWYSHHDAGDLVALLTAEHRPAPGELAPVATVSPEVAAALPVALLERLA